MSPKTRVAYCSLTLMMELREVCAEFDTSGLFSHSSAEKVFFYIQSDFGASRCAILWKINVKIKFFYVLKHVRMGFSLGYIHTSQHR